MIDEIVKYKGTLEFYTEDVRDLDMAKKHFSIGNQNRLMFLKKKFIVQKSSKALISKVGTYIYI